MNFFSLQEGYIPHLSIPFYLMTLLICPFLIYLSFKYHKVVAFKNFFLILQASQLISLYGWYIMKGFPLQEALPLYHCRIGMLAIFLLPNKTVLKQLFMLLGVAGPILAVLSPDLYPYPLFHATNVAFYLGHYALLVNALIYLQDNYDDTLSSKRQFLNRLAIINLSLVIINSLTKGNYGFLKEVPIIHSHHLFINFFLVTFGLLLMAKLVEVTFISYANVHSRKISQGLKV
ncbi:TIGR02206 family membrane protein [Streptococcus uberis]|uniref:TMEM164-related integral membrane acyltransferase n=1 Tax=Streptococcus uberis TaxID=1349 RepID=UPI0012B54EF8|nr:TIGR02206 family membrane protein [Streptococcus uberis]MCK1258228.1 TIGR02206 family membrane protein [Streptococcus uberis]MTB36453.1 TIGR02206 family membrane protein [Streptococcus uberis]MTB37710.1 TIGR02206 family membrane protein [Streptococcus uberis]MTB54320.1 TIGR02206 family membrane protein [Streptococcus uberis]MTB61482.1 TIGR02206 family membrane protein [Streptococcus uberis]